jgi:hypothetical protein
MYLRGPDVERGWYKWLTVAPMDEINECISSKKSQIALAGSNSPVCKDDILIYGAFLNCPVRGSNGKLCFP